MRSIRNPPLTVESTTRVPPGAYVSRFYQMNDLVANTSGVDCHPVGARLIRVVGLLGTVSTADVTFAIQKNDTEVFTVTIPANEQMVSRDVLKVESEISMDFRPVVDTIRVAITAVGSGAKDLTVLAIFDR